MSQIYTIPCNRNEDVFIHAIPGHYVTASAHLNYYVGTSDIKHNRVVSVEAAKLLEAEGIHIAVINVHTIKPIDAECVTEWAEKCGKVITVEEHSVIGGLGDAVADVLMGKVNCKFHKIGVNDRFGQSGKAADVLREYGLTADQIAETVKVNI